MYFTHQFHFYDVKRVKFIIELFVSNLEELKRFKNYEIEEK